jgi:hypothetical protein
VRRRAALTGHVAGSVGEYVRAVAVEKERVAALEKEKAALERRLADESSVGDKSSASSELAAAKEAAVALAEVATASVKAELDAVRLELAAAKATAAAAEKARAAELDAATNKRKLAEAASTRRERGGDGNVPSPSDSPSGSPSGSPGSGAKPPRPPRTPPSARRALRVSAAAAAPNDENRSSPATTPRRPRAASGATPEKRADTAERAAHSVVARVRVSAERRVDEATREARDARAIAQRLGEELASCRAELDAAVAVAARAEASAAFGDVFGSSDASATRVARLDAAFAAACSTLEALGETAAMAAMGGWIAVAETLEAPVPGVAALEGLADESGKDARLSPDTFGRAGSKPETRMCRAVRDVVAAVRDAAAVAAAAEERVIGGG